MRPLTIVVRLNEDEEAAALADALHLALLPPKYHYSDLVGLCQDVSIGIQDVSIGIKMFLLVSSKEAKATQSPAAVAGVRGGGAGRRPEGGKAGGSWGVPEGDGRAG